VPDALRGRESVTRVACRTVLGAHLRDLVPTTAGEMFLHGDWLASSSLIHKTHDALR
jgi:hypothetical protein